MALLVKRSQHGSAKTTPAMRRAIQNSKASLHTLAARYGINPKTVQKWRKRPDVRDAPMGPAATRLSTTEEKIVVGFRRHTLLPLDDCLYALQATLPHLTRTTLHRCLQRYGISRLPDNERSPFEADPLGSFRIDIGEMDTAEGKYYIFLAIDRTSQLIYSRQYEKADRRAAHHFLKALIEAVPYRIHTVLSDNRFPFGGGSRSHACALTPHRSYRFDITCQRNVINHQLTRPDGPWTPHQVARLKRMIAGLSTTDQHFQTRREADRRALAFRTAYNFNRRLKSLGGLTPFAFICKAWSREPELFRSDPRHLTWN